MRCPRCASADTRVVDSREGDEGFSVRRRRVCGSCESRFTTFERIVESFPLVVKRSGQREFYDREKILGGLRKACEKREVSVEQIEELLRSVEAALLETAEKEVSSVQIGEMVIERLRELDQVAYVRFASVYRNFSDINEFTDTLRDLVQSKLGQSVTVPAKLAYPLPLKKIKETSDNSSKESELESLVTASNANRGTNAKRGEKQQELGFSKSNLNRLALLQKGPIDGEVS